MVGQHSARFEREHNPLSPEDVLDLLRLAHKRRTVGNQWLYGPEGKWNGTERQRRALEVLRRCVNDVVLRRWGQPLPPDVKKVSELIHRGQEAVNELRRVLPRYIARLHTELERGPNALLGLGEDRSSFEREWKSRQAQLIQAYSHMHSCLLDFEPKKRQHKIRAIWPETVPWKENAVELYEMFKFLMGKASTTQNGPAVRFVQSVLKRAGIDKDNRTIEQMLRRCKSEAPKKLCVANVAEEALTAGSRTPKDYK